MVCRSFLGLEVSIFGSGSRSSWAVSFYLGEPSLAEVGRSLHLEGLREWWSFPSGRAPPRVWSWGAGLLRDSVPVAASASPAASPCRGCPIASSSILPTLGDCPGWWVVLPCWAGLWHGAVSWSPGFTNELRLQGPSEDGDKESSSADV